MACLAVAMMSASSHAQVLYDFINDGTGEVLARLELAMLPATKTIEKELTFTPRGEAIFGLGPLYLGSFDTQSGPGRAVIDDGAGGLVGDMGFVTWTDDDPPYASVPPIGEPALLFRLEFSDDTNTLLDSIVLEDVAGSLTERAGEWRLVPEPSGFAIVGAAVFVCSGIGRRRKRQGSRHDVATGCRSCRSARITA